MKFKTFDQLREWFVGRDEQQDDEPDYVEADVDECPMGGEHDVQEIRAATAREPLGRHCVKCRRMM